MSVSLQQEGRPPYVVFEERQIEDRAASEREKRYVARPVDYVIVRQSGSKDSLEVEALDWLDRISKNPGYKPDWVTGYRAHYDAWKKGQEIPVNGTRIRDWPSISKAQVEMLSRLLVHTVEDLASANEETIQRIGIGGRDLKQKAQAWLNEGKRADKAEAQMSELQVKNAELEKQIAELRNFIQQKNGLPLTQAGNGPSQVANTPMDDPFE